jgi:hypothetical protein
MRPEDSMFKFPMTLDAPGMAVFLQSAPAFGRRIWDWAEEERGGQGTHDPGDAPENADLQKMLSAIEELKKMGDRTRASCGPKPDLRPY